MHLSLNIYFPKVFRGAQGAQGVDLTSRTERRAPRCRHPLSPVTRPPPLSCGEDIGDLLSPQRDSIRHSRVSWSRRGQDLAEGHLSLSLPAWTVWETHRVPLAHGTPRIGKADGACFLWGWVWGKLLSLEKHSVTIAAVFRWARYNPDGTGAGDLPGLRRARKHNLVAEG